MMLSSPSAPRSPGRPAGVAAAAATVAVVIVTRNTCKLTCAAVQSIHDSQDGFTKEIVVVDNASTDDTAAILPRRFPGVKYLPSTRNLGFAGANNLGAKGVHAEFILLLNSDARLEPDALAKAVEWMRSRPDCGIAGAQLLNPDGSLQNSIANFPSLATELLHKPLLRRLLPHRFPGKEHGFTEPVEVESVIGAFMLIRREVWEQIGGLDERYFFFFEETDFCLQAHRRGWKVFHLPRVRVWHEQGGSGGEIVIPVRVEYWRSRYAFFARNSSRLTQFLLRAGLGGRLLVNWLCGALMKLLTLGRSARWRNAWKVNTALALWHLKGCPSQPGIPR